MPKTKTSYVCTQCGAVQPKWMGKCPDCGREVKPAKEEAYFFKMSKYADKLINYINEHPEFIQPVSRKNEMMNNFLLPGLQDLCVSRTSFSWGIPVDFDPKHVVYVWLDALTNYITKIGYDADGNSSDLFNKNWPADLHLIGKDIIRFHTIYWPIFLMALDLPLPKQVFGHPWLLQGGEKMSKSKGNVIYADDMADLFGVDATRYFVLHEMPFENDGIITWDLVIERYNSDLANILGNLVNRTISMSNKYFDGVVKSTGVTEEVDADLKAVVTSARDKVAEKMKNLRVADAITEVFNLFRRCNKYIDETAPWVLAKDEAAKDRLAEVLYNLVESITIGACLLKSFLPETADRILAQLNAGMREYDNLDKFGLYENGNKVTDKPEILFARMDIKEVMEKVNEALYESKLIGYPRPWKNKVRTFCQNPGGFVAQENYDNDLAVVNGHSFKDKKSENTNLAILVSHNFTEPFNQPIEYAQKVGELTNMLGAGHIMVQRFGDILDGKRTWQYELNKSNVKPTLKDAVAGDITAAMPYRAMTNIIEFIKMLDIVVPGFASTETLLYSPELKFYSNKVKMDENLNTNIKGLHCLGDSSGWTRGLMMASVMGVLMGQKLSDAENN